MRRPFQLPGSTALTPSLALAAMLLAAGARETRAQVFEVRGGGSSVESGYGGLLNVWGAGYEGSVGLGYLDGWRVSVFAKRRLGHDTLRLGNDVIPLRLPTDLFNSASGLLVQGASLERVTSRTRILAFGGASATAVAAPHVLALRSGRGMGILQLERALARSTTLTTRAVFTGRQTLLQGVHWESGDTLHAGLAAGVGANDPYAAAGFEMQRRRFDLRASYVSQGADFRRAAVPTPIQAEADRENVLLTVRPRPDLALGIGRQNFRQDSIVPGAPTRATLNQLFGNVRYRGTNFATGVFDSRADRDRNLSSYVSASRDLSRWLQAQYYVLRVWDPAPARATTQVLYLREFLTPRLGLLQVVTRDDEGRAAVSFGGNFTSGLASVSVDYQLVHTPYRPRDPFVQALALSVRLQLGGYQLSGGSFVTPDGRVNYAASGSTFFYMGESAIGGPRAPTIRFERFLVQGRVVDESGTPVEGAAIEIGKELVFSDSRGRFFLRTSSNRSATMRVLTGEFLLPGRFEVVTAPETVRPDRDGRTRFVDVVLRRIVTPNNNNGPAAPTSGGTGTQRSEGLPFPR